jgi:hypothetical protein
MKKTELQRLAVVWTSGDPEVAEKVCFMGMGSVLSGYLKENWKVLTF